MEATAAASLARTLASSPLPRGTRRSRVRVAVAPERRRRGRAVLAAAASTGNYVVPLDPAPSGITRPLVEILRVAVARERLSRGRASPARRRRASWCRPPSRPSFPSSVWRAGAPELVAAVSVARISSGKTSRRPSGGLFPLLQQLNEHGKLSMLRNATWTLSNFCRGKPQLNFEQVKPALSALQRLIHSQDEEVLTDACWALSYLSDGTNDKINS
uniref:Importin subunit alpha-1b n=1 Tax=Aegilops tauschii TaxID=37682 RepID=M8CBT9_AEGTA